MEILLFALYNRVILSTVNNILYRMQVTWYLSYTVEPHEVGCPEVLADSAPHFG